MFQAKRNTSSTELKKREIRALAEGSLKIFINLVHPQRLLGHIHEEVCSWWTRPDAKSHQLLLLPRDHQKVLSADTPVIMHDGTTRKTVDLEVNDLLACPLTGTSTKVTQVHPLGSDDYYKITLDDGRTVEAGIGHLWEVHHQGSTKDNSPIVRSTEWILERYKRERLEPRTGNLFIEHKTAIMAPVPLEFEDRELLIHPYVLGAWLGDGTSASARITSEDDIIPTRVCSLGGYTLTKGKDKYSYGLTGNLQVQLRQLDLLKNKHIPSVYLKGSIEQRLELLKGLLDTDGSINKINGIVSFSQCSKREALLDQVASLVRSLGGKAKKHEAWTTCKGKKFKSFTLNIWLPKEIGNPFWLKRKQDIYTKEVRFKPQMLKSFIVSIDPIGKKVSHCITVSNNNGTYLCGDYVKTHNSAMVAYRVAWEITKNPAIRVLYLSATANLAEKQLGFIKDILTSPIYQYYWPEMINPIESRRQKWNKREISIDHPYRKEQIIRDPTVFTAGLTSTITGMHCDIAVLDDIVVSDNALTQEGRKKVALQASYLSSILGGDGRAWVVGTFYHPKDLYHDMIKTTYDIFDEETCEKIGVENLYEVKKHEVESRGDGTGEFLWPKQKNRDGKEFGFDMLTLSKKKAQYNDYTQFRAQYYNDPNDMATAAIKPSMFQYYNREHLTQDMQRWYYNKVPLNIIACIDFAYTIGIKSDYTSIIVLGIDPEYNYYVLDIDRFRTDQISEYYSHIALLYHKWNFRTLKAETNAGQKPIVEALKNDYIRRKGLVLTVEGYAYKNNSGTKEERIANTLVPRYSNKQIWHYKGGNCQTLEEELVLQRPEHDDIKDVLSAAIDGLEPPSMRLQKRRSKPLTFDRPNTRFGGFTSKKE